eukprot:2061535-Lingulodinium_polyedra.AAC.1
MGRLTLRPTDRATLHMLAPVIRDHRHRLRLARSRPALRIDLIVMTCSRSRSSPVSGKRSGSYS